MCGELAYAIHAGLELDSELKMLGDGGTDFCGTTDVKSTVYWRDPILKVDIKKENWPERFVLVAVDIEGKRAKVIGSAPSWKLRAGPVIDFGRGPTFTLRPEELTREWDDEKWFSPENW
jgi:hypothetical protein